MSNDPMMGMALERYGNFFAVVAIQLLWFLLVAWRRRTLHTALRYLLIGAIAGLPIGILFDIFVGRLASVFHYNELELTGTFLILNSVLSYGVAVATVLSMRFKELPIRQDRRRGAQLATAFFVYTFGLWLWIDSAPPIGTLFLVGVAVLLFSEATALICEHEGYVAQIVNGRWRPAMSAWTFSVLTGIIYETANYIFPLWVWYSQTPTPADNIILVVIFGYVILIVPMIVVTSLVRPYVRASSLYDRPT